MTVQANPAPLGLAWQTPHVGPAPVAELRCQNRRSARSSSAEKVVLKPRNCVPQITVWQRVLQQLLRVRGVGSPSPASPSPRTSAPQTSSPSPAVPVQSPSGPMDFPAVPDVPQTSRHPTPSRGPLPRYVPAIPRRPQVVPQTSLPSWGCPRSSSGRPCHPRPSRGPSPRRPVNPGRPRLSRGPGLSGHHPPPQPLARRCRPDRGTTVRF
jgi:hypothetical protein